MYELVDSFVGRWTINTTMRWIPPNRQYWCCAVLTPQDRRDEGSNCGTNDSQRDAATVVSQDEINCKCFIENTRHNQRTLAELAAQTSISLLFQFSQQLSDFLPGVWARFRQHWILHTHVWINTETETVLCTHKQYVTLVSIHLCVVSL